MDKDESILVIKAAGGDRAFARLLGIDSVQRVNNWKRRGIPSDVILDNFEVIRRLRAAVEVAALPLPGRNKRPSTAARKSLGR